MLAFLILQAMQGGAIASTPTATTVEPAAQPPVQVANRSLPVPSEFKVFPTGLSIGRRVVVDSTLVRGLENGTEAVQFQRWLIPLEALTKALKLDIKTLSDGNLEVKSPGKVVKIDPKSLMVDPELGLVMSIEQVQQIFEVPAVFNFAEYAIEFQPQWVDTQTGLIKKQAIDLQLSGLTAVRGPAFALSSIEQRVNIAGGSQVNPSYQGDTLITGTLDGGSWVARVNQPAFQDSRSWNLGELQYVKQSDRFDWSIGSQPTFWNSLTNSADYWGATAILRQGFVPPMSYSGGSFSPAQRLQSNQLGRTIVGRAAPGTLVRLVEGLGEQTFAEVLVDSSGIYRFADVPIEADTFRGYRLLLYPQGRLTAQPEVRDLTFATVPGQLPPGTSATIVSVGGKRSMLRQNFFGDWTDFQGGVAQRFGISESFTVGVGGIYDENFRGLGELFFKPANFPITAAVSVLSGDRDNRWSVNANVLANLSPDLTAQFDTDRFSSRASLDWRANSWLGLLANYNSIDGISGGVRINFSGRNSFTFAQATLDEKNRFRWNLIQRLGRLELTQFGNESATNSELTLSLSRNIWSHYGHWLFARYDTFNFNQSNSLAVLGWRYRSQNQSFDGRFNYELELGYGFGSQGSGLVASAGTTIIPGLMIRGRYQGISTTSRESSYSIELVSSPSFQNGLFPGDRKANDFRLWGGLMVQPFLDANNNGTRDDNEEVVTEDAQEMLVLNQEPIPRYRLNRLSDRLLVRLAPGQYRLDLDPAGFPMDTQSMIDSYAVEVVPGAYTPLMIPLVTAYSLTGTVTDAQGKAIPGARIELVDRTKKQRKFTSTNSAGGYSFDRIPPGKYEFQVNGQVIPDKQMTLDAKSVINQEVNLTLPKP